MSFFPDFKQIWIFSTIFKKYSNMIIHENPFTGSRAVPCGRLEGRKEGRRGMSEMMVTFCNLGTRLKSKFLPPRAQLLINYIDQSVHQPQFVMRIKRTARQTSFWQHAELYTCYTRWCIYLPLGSIIGWTPNKQVALLRQSCCLSNSAPQHYKFKHNNFAQCHAKCTIERSMRLASDLWH